MFFNRRKASIGLGEKDKGSPRTPRSPTLKYLEIFPQVPPLSHRHSRNSLVKIRTQTSALQRWWKPSHLEEESTREVRKYWRNLSVIIGWDSDEMSRVSEEPDAQHIGNMEQTIVHLQAHVARGQMELEEANLHNMELLDQVEKQKARVVELEKEREELTALLAEERHKKSAHMEEVHKERDTLKQSLTVARANVSKLDEEIRLLKEKMEHQRLLLEEEKLAHSTTRKQLF